MGRWVCFVLVMVLVSAACLNVYAGEKRSVSFGDSNVEMQAITQLDVDSSLEAIILEESFEMGDTSAWSYPAISANEYLAISPDGARHGRYGLVSGITAADGWRWALLPHAVPEEFYIRFAFRIDDLILNNGQSFQILELETSTVRRIFTINVTKDKDEDKLFLISGGMRGDKEIIPGQWHEIIAYFKSGEGDGTALIDLDGVRQITLDNKDFIKPGKLLLGVLTNTSGVGAALSYDDVLISKTELAPSTKRVRLVHMGFHAKVGMRILVFPELFEVDERMKVVLQSTKIGEQLLYEHQAPLPGRTEFTFSLRSLPADDYTMLIRLYNSSGTKTYELKETFTKRYNGVPISGIDENGNFCIHGKPIIIAYGFGLNRDLVPDWAENGYINGSHHIGMGWPDNRAVYARYLDQLGALGYPLIGPGRISYDDQKAVNVAGNFDEGMKWYGKYIDAFIDHEAQLAWTIGDEAVSVNNVPYDYACEYFKLFRDRDPLRLTVASEAGNWFVPGNEGNNRAAKKFTYPHNIADVYMFNYYPFEERLRRGTKMSGLATVCQVIDRWNYGLHPFMNAIEVVDQKFILDPPQFRTREVPLPGQIRAMVWISLIHGAKGFTWYHHDGGAVPKIPPENYREMARITDQITRVNYILTGPKSQRLVTNNAGELDSRVDTMVRETNTHIYIFALRVSEVLDTDPPKIQVTFNVEGVNTCKAEVFDEKRQVNIVDGVFTDEFVGDEHNFHIYRIPKMTGSTNRPPVFDSNYNQREKVGGRLSFAVSASDPDGDDLIYSVVDSPVGADFNPVTRIFSWVPEAWQEGTYMVRFNVTDGSYTTSNEATIIIEETELLPPENLQAPVVSTNQVDLSWDPINDVAGYVIYRDGLQIGVSKTADFADESALPNRSYTYTVVSFDKKGQTSGNTMEVTVATPNGTGITPMRGSHNANAGVGMFEVISSTNWNVTVDSTSPWLQITSSSTGNGNGIVTYSVEANTGSRRQGVISAAGQTFTVTQQAANKESLLGFYNPEDQTFKLWNKRLSRSHAIPDLEFYYGPGGERRQPVMGDWDGDGISTAGIYDPDEKKFYLRNVNEAGDAEIIFLFDTGGDDNIAIVGDWNGDGKDSVGVYDPVTSIFFFTNAILHDVEAEVDHVLPFKPIKYTLIQPVAGDWDGDGLDTVGLYDLNNNLFHLTSSLETGIVDLLFTYRSPEALWHPVRTLQPIAGDWDGDQVDTIGLFHTAEGRFWLRNSNSSGRPDISLNYGSSAADWIPLYGDWVEEE